MQRIIKSNVQSGFALAAVTAVSFALIGGTSAAAMNSTQQDKGRPAHATSQQDNSTKESQAAIDLRNGLDSLLRDHVTTNLDVNRAITSGASDAVVAELEQAQFANTAALAAAVESIYGPEAAAQFTEMFNEHIAESNAFAQAVAAGDESAKDAAIEELNEYLAEITVFFTTAIPGLPYDAVYGLLLEHEELINKSTVALETQNFGQSKKFEQQALRQISVIADALASSIIATQPGKF